MAALGAGKAAVSRRPIILLDEPSASLDPVGERQIFALLASLAHEKIILFTAHRYDTIRKADTIMVLVDGRIAEVGTHEELEQKAGTYWSLYLGQGARINAIYNFEASRDCSHLVAIC